jgi:beta-lactamase superfamily II metal-dependent hydrolase
VWLGRNPMVPSYRELIQNIHEKQIPIRWVSSGQIAGPFTVLHPPPEWRTRRTAQNDDSVVLLLKAGSRTALLTGDIERKIDAPAKVDVLKISHHGSRNVRLQTKADVRVASVGGNNPFGHPHPSTLPALRTDVLGAIQVVLSEERPPSVSALTGICPSCKLTFLLNSH